VLGKVQPGMQRRKRAQHCNVVLPPSPQAGATSAVQRTCDGSIHVYCIQHVQLAQRVLQGLRLCSRMNPEKMRRLVQLAFNTYSWRPLGTRPVRGLPSLRCGSQHGAVCSGRRDGAEVRH